MGRLLVMWSLTHRKGGQGVRKWSLVGASDRIGKKTALYRATIYVDTSTLKLEPSCSS
jgi:hypothetical protein